MRKSYFFSLIGLLLGLGSPFGALILLWLFPHPNLPIPTFIDEEWRDHFFFFTYMTAGSCLIFTLFGFWVGKGEDLLLKRDRRLTDQVNTDPLTGLGNHRFLHERFQVEFRHHLSNHQPLSCLMLDLDHFKRINDTYGHPFGDHVLQQFGKIVRESTRNDSTRYGKIRKPDVATRYGGEEFLCILLNCDNIGAKKVAERIRARTAHHLFLKGKKRVKVTVSIGTATTRDSKDVDYKKLIDQADKALYRAKRGGRNRVAQSPKA